MLTYKIKISAKFKLPHVGGEVGHHVAEGVEGAERELDEEAPQQRKAATPRDAAAGLPHRVAVRIVVCDLGGDIGGLIRISRQKSLLKISSFSLLSFSSILGEMLRVGVLLEGRHGCSPSSTLHRLVSVLALHLRQSDRLLRGLPEDFSQD